MKSVLKYGIIAISWIAFILIGLGGVSSDKKNNEGTIPTEQPAQIEPTIPTGDNAEKDTFELEIIAGEIGKYGKELVLDEGTEFEDHTVGYFVPTGKYKVTNIGKHPTQVNVYKNEKHITEEGWEEWGDGKAELLDLNASVEINVEDGYFINVDDPSHILIKKID